MAEKKKTKGKGCFIALGVAVVIVILLYFGVMFILDKAKTVVEDFADGLGVSPKLVEEVKTLNRQFPFTPPADGLISEIQVQKFIKIKSDFADDIKRHEAEFKALGQRTERREAGFKEFSQAIKILGNIRRDFLNSLQRNGMSPQEYLYLNEQIYLNYFTVGWGEEVDEIAQENIELLNRYRAELEELNTFGFEFWGLALAAVDYE